MTTTVFAYLLYTVPQCPVMLDSKIGKTFCYIGKIRMVQWRPSWSDKWIIYIENCEAKIGCNITMIILYAKHFHYGSKTNILSKGLMLL
jgi:hypothetical protein